MKLFRFFKGHGLAVLICTVLLIAQATLELSLPNYMSDIVDVGLQQGGVESPVPKTIRASELAKLESAMSSEDAALVDAAYSSANTDGIRTYVGSDADAKTDGSVAQALIGPECQALEAQETGDADASANAGASAGMTQKGGDAGANTAAGANGASTNATASTNASTGMLAQRAIDFVKLEYKAQGVDLVATQNDYLARTATIMFALCLGTLITTIGVGLVASRTAATIARDTRKKLFNRVMRFSAKEVNEFSQASLITRSTNDVQQVQMVCVLLLRVVMLAPIMGIVAFVQVLATRSGMEWIIGIAVIAILAVLGILFGTTMPKFKLMQSLVDRLNLVSRDMLDGIMPIRAFGRESYEIDRFDKASKDLMHTQLFVNRAMAFMMPTIMFIMNLITLLIVWIGAHGAAAGSVQVGTMMAFITYAMQIVMSFMMLGMIAVILPRAQVAAGRITEVIECPLSITSPASPLQLDDGAPGGAPSDGALQDVVEFRHVTFSYPDAKRPVLDDISFAIQKGKTLGIIGSTGSGKSTLVQLIPRLYDAPEGEVLFCGVDVRKLALGELRKRIGYVPQQGFLFSGTIESNIKFADESMSDERMERAAHIAQATEFIDREPDGFKSPIAQGGSNVSGGQRQRLSIARALASDPDVLVFDDSFSALDYATDASLRHSLAENVTNTAVIIVAQRVATIMQADDILVLEGGRMVGHGTHGELLEGCETYREIALSQLSPSELGLEGQDAREVCMEARKALDADALASTRGEAPEATPPTSAKGGDVR